MRGIGLVDYSVIIARKGVVWGYDVPEGLLAQGIIFVTAFLTLYPHTDEDIQECKYHSIYPHLV